MSLESLGIIWKHYSIPDEYVLHAPRLGQRPYHPCLGSFSISIDALEAGLRFPLHLVIGVSRVVAHIAQSGGAELLALPHNISRGI
ncbi:hypothetical protein BHM03_00041990 [Ensete ventricosum]|nr:hypothetical protein BHM03_00041990 [Ensete ventricosum]